MRGNNTTGQTLLTRNGNTRLTQKTRHLLPMAYIAINTAATEQSQSLSVTVFKKTYKSASTPRRRNVCHRRKHAFGSAVTLTLDLWRWKPFQQCPPW